MREIYRWYFTQEGVLDASGIVIAESNDEAITKVKTYLQTHWPSEAQNMQFIIANKSAVTELTEPEPTLWVWPCDRDDDYIDSCPDCIAVTY